MPGGRCVEADWLLGLFKRGVWRFVRDNIHESDWDRGMNRRMFLAALAAGVTSAFSESAGKERAEEGKKSVAPLDEAMRRFMSARGIPGGALAVSRKGRLVYAHGYGWADRERRIAVGNRTRFRIASLSKPVTAAAVMRLVQEGRLELDARMLDVLRPEGEAGIGGWVVEDPRLAKITIRHLLQHTAGWDREQGVEGDPMFRSREIARTMGRLGPATTRDVMRYMWGRPLDFEPGTRYAYSNFGYCVLGRVIESVAGCAYERFVRRELLSPIGVTRMRLGASLEKGRYSGETRYYMRDEAMGENVFSTGPQRVPWPYGAFCLEAMDSHGGWIATASDLVRFASLFDEDRGEAGRRLFRSDTLKLIFEPPAGPVGHRPDGSAAEVYYGCGWMVRRVGRGRGMNQWHNGSLPGTYSLLVRRWDGLAWAVLFNQRSELKELPDSAIDPELHRAVDASVFAAAR